MTRKPISFDMPPQDEAQKPKPATATKKTKAARKPRAIPPPKITIEPEEFDTAASQTPIAPTGQTHQLKKAFRWGALFLTAFTSLTMMWASLTFIRLIEDLFARSPILGWIGTGFLSLAGLAALVIFLREIFGLFALRKISKIQEDAEIARNTNDQKSADRVLYAIKSLYQDRPEIVWDMQNLKSHEDDIIDPADRITLIERDLMIGLDEQAGQIIASASRRVTLLTAVTPAAILDILFVAAQNLKMLRQLATLYGGRPGTIGTFKLAGMVVSHLAVAGGLALTDGLVQSFIGKGLLGRLSARFGEGAVNGILTTRIGIAALDLTRPIPFSKETRPSLSQFLKNTLSFKDAGKQDSSVE